MNDKEATLRSKGRANGSAMYISGVILCRATNWLICHGLKRSGEVLIRVSPGATTITYHQNLENIRRELGDDLYSRPTNFRTIFTTAPKHSRQGRPRRLFSDSLLADIRLDRSVSTVREFLGYSRTFFFRWYVKLNNFPQLVTVNWIFCKQIVTLHQPQIRFISLVICPLEPSSMILMMLLRKLVKR